MKTALLGLGAVFAGLIAIVVPSIVTDGVLNAVGFLPTLGPMNAMHAVAALAYRTLYGVLGSAVTARLAPTRPRLLTAVLASLGIAVGTAATIATWNQPEFGPKWYNFAVAAMPVWCAWLGLKLAQR